MVGVEPCGDGRAVAPGGAASAGSGTRHARQGIRRFMDWCVVRAGFGKCRGVCHRIHSGVTGLAGSGQGVSENHRGSTRRGAGGIGVCDRDRRIRFVACLRKAGHGRSGGRRRIRGESVDGVGDHGGNRAGVSRVNAGKGNGVGDRFHNRLKGLKNSAGNWGHGFHRTVQHGTDSAGNRVHHRAHRSGRHYAVDDGNGLHHLVGKSGDVFHRRAQGWRGDQRRNTRDRRIVRTALEGGLHRFQGTFGLMRNGGGDGAKG